MQQFFKINILKIIPSGGNWILLSSFEENPAMLLEAGTHFYKASIGDWICLKLNPELVAGPVIYEAPAPVGNIEAKKYENSPKFPHIYGGIPSAAVIRQYKIVRGSDGTFLSIENLC
eukprot:gene27159-35883_t